MGFWCDSLESGLKQHINLSEGAWIVINQDMNTFGLSLSGILNAIFKNFYEDANASIELRCLEEKQKLETMFSERSFNSLKQESKQILIKKIIDNFRNELIKKNAYKNGSSKKFRINVDNLDILMNDSNEDKNYVSIGKYLKAIYEEYSMKLNYERETIIFKEQIETIESGIRNQKILKIGIESKPDSDSEAVHSRFFNVKPYKIVQDATRSYNYLIGLSQEILTDGASPNEIMSSFRISRINSVRVMKSQGAHLSTSIKEKIDKDMMVKLPQFMAGDIIDVKVKFTKKGLENYKRLLHLKPLLYDVVDENNHVFVFHCTELQAIDYFVKFVRDVEIIEPISLREKFIERYREALKVYC